MTVSKNLCSKRYFIKIEKNFIIFKKLILNLLLNISKAKE